MDGGRVVVATGMDRVGRMLADMPSRRDFNYTVHVSPELGFVFFSNPITACSTMKATLNAATARALGLPAPSLKLSDIHDRDRNPLKRPADIGLARFAAMLDDPAVRKICFIRDPAQRLVSCVSKKFQKDNRMTQRLRVHLGIGAEVPPAVFLTPDRFAFAVRDDHGLRDLDEHWRLQRKQVFFDHVPDLQVGRLETLGQDLERLLLPIFGAGGFELIDVPSLFPQNSARTRSPVAPLSEEGRAAVRAAYAEDYAMLAAIEGGAAQVEPVPSTPRTGPKPDVPAAATRDPEKPRLVLHIGMGKTGTSAVQAALREHGAGLKAQNAAYLGMWFDLPGETAQGWAANAAFLRQPPQRLAALGRAWGDALAARMQREGLTCAILSNESLIGAAGAMAAFLEPLRDRFAIEALAWARDPAGWLPSAYGQWGIRDKTVPGPVEPYLDAARRLVGRYRGVLIWAERLPELLVLRPYTRGIDIVADFAEAARLTLPSPGTRVYERREPAELLMRALFNGAQAGTVGPDLFDRALRPQANVPDLAALAGRHLDHTGTDAVIAENAAMFDGIARITGLDLRRLGEVPPPAPSAEVLRARLLDILMSVVLDQASRITALEDRLADQVSPAAAGRR